MITSMDVHMGTPDKVIASLLTVSILASVAANLAAALRYGAVDKSERGIALWRLRERYLRIAAYLVRTGHTLVVRLSGLAVATERQTLWRTAFAAAGRL